MNKLWVRGFTWIELLVILAIVAALALIAYPNLKNVVITADEAGMRNAMRAFREANEAYRHTRKPNQYAPSITELVAPESGPSLLDSMWMKPSLYGFNVTYAGGGEAHPESYSLLAEPAARYAKGIDTYCVDQKGIVLGSVKGKQAPRGTAAGCENGMPIVG